jgi:hypothetical protein
MASVSAFGMIRVLKLKDYEGPQRLVSVDSQVHSVVFFGFRAEAPVSTCQGEQNGRFSAPRYLVKTLVEWSRP